MEKQKNKKSFKILNIIVNIIVGIILVIALAVTINNITSSKKGYTSIFGQAFLVVQTDSMDGPKPEGFEDSQCGFVPGDLVRMRELSSSEKNNLAVGDIISYLVPVENGYVIDSHRIVEVKTTEEGVVYATKGDNPAYSERTDMVYAQQGNREDFYVIGRIEENLGRIGVMFNFFHSSTGFLVCIVIPSFLVVIYFAVNLFVQIAKVKKAGAKDRDEQTRERILAELREQGLLADNAQPENGAKNSEENKADTETK